MSLSTIPNGQEPERIKQWLRVDSCLRTLLRCIYVYSAPPSPDTALDEQLAREHDRECGDCERNVRTVAYCEPEGPKRRFYRGVLLDFHIAWMRQRGGSFDVKESPDGLRFQYQPAPDLGLPFIGVEAFKPKSEMQSGQLIYDAGDEDLLNNPGPLLQFLDLKATGRAQKFPPQTGKLYWGAILGERPFEVFVRWRGRRKLISPDWALYKRYEQDIQRELKKQGRLRKAVTGYDPDEISPGDKVAVLATIAREYRSDLDSVPFKDYLKWLLPNRLKDQWDSVKTDALASGTLSLDDTNSAVGDRREHSSAVMALAVKDWPECERTLYHEIDGPRLVSCFLSQLDPVEYQVLRSKLERRTDSEIADSLGYARETVTRMWGGIRQKASRVRDPGKAILRKRRRKRPRAKHQVTPTS